MKINRNNIFIKIQSSEKPTLESSKKIKWVYLGHIYIDNEMFDIVTNSAKKYIYFIQNSSDDKKCYKTIYNNVDKIENREFYTLTIERKEK